MIELSPKNKKRLENANTKGELKFVMSSVMTMFWIIFLTVLITASVMIYIFESSLRLPLLICFIILLCIDLSCICFRTTTTIKFDRNKEELDVRTGTMIVNMQKEVYPFELVKEFEIRRETDLEQGTDERKVKEGYKRRVHYHIYLVLHSGEKVEIFRDKELITVQQELLLIEQFVYGTYHEEHFRLLGDMRPEAEQVVPSLIVYTHYY